MLSSFMILTLLSARELRTASSVLMQNVLKSARAARETLAHWQVIAIRTMVGSSLRPGLTPPSGAKHSASVTVLAGVIGLLGVGITPVRSQAPQTKPHIFNSLHGLQVVGYQGWYACPGDGAGGGWGHWFVAGSNTKDPSSIAFDEWPDTSELGPDERCPTDFKLPSDTPAYLFSNQNPKTVARHFRWMKDNDIDGAAMQQFTVSLSNNAVGRRFDIVLRNARGGAEANGRGFFVMYDISGMNGAAALEAITKDWLRLTGDLRVADSPSYIYHRGKPVVGVWGLGFKDRDVTPDQAVAIIHFLKTASVPATVLGGVPTSWRNLGINSRWPDARPESGWAALYRSLDVISPWSVGRFRDDEAADNSDAFVLSRISPKHAGWALIICQSYFRDFPGTTAPDEQQIHHSMQSLGDAATFIDIR